MEGLDIVVEVDKQREEEDDEAEESMGMESDMEEDDPLDCWLALEEMELLRCLFKLPSTIIISS